MFFTDIRTPLYNIHKLQSELNNLFRPVSPGNGRGHSFPLVNMWQHEDNVVIGAEIPGMDREKIEIVVLDDVLTLSGERENQVSDDITYHRRERRTGGFKRVVKLPFRINADKVEAHYEKGVLTIHLTRAEEDKPRRINIKS